MSQSIKLKDNTFWDMDSIRTTENVRVAGTNLNSYTHNGCYYFDSQVTPIGIPSGTNGWLVVVAEQPINEGRGTGYIKQFWLRSGEPNVTDFLMYTRTCNVGISNWGSWRRIIVEDDIFYLSGDTYGNSNTLYLGGHITGSTKSLCTNLPVPKRLDKISTITITSYDISVRAVGGGYLLNRATSGLTVSAVKSDNGNIALTFDSSTAFSTTNNTPIGIAIYKLTLSFT